MLKNDLNIYKETLNRIFSTFDNEHGYGEIDIKTDVKWNITPDSVRWIEKECMYSNDLRGDPKYAEGHMMVFVDNGCGDSFYQIFDVSLKDENLDE